MKTALELLIEDLKLQQSNWSLQSDIEYERANFITFGAAIEIATKLLPTEKQQIIDAVVWFDDTDRRPKEIEKDIIDYYNQTFKK